MLLKKSSILFVFFTFILCSFGMQSRVLAADPPPPESPKWNMFLPAITIKQSAPEAYWAAWISWVQCPPPATLTFTVTIDGVTQKSVKKATDPDGTLEGWAITEPGAKTAAWQATGCGTWTGTVSHTLEADKNYMFILDADMVTGDPFVTVTEGTGKPAQ